MRPIKRAFKPKPPDSPHLKALLATSKKDSRLLGDVQRLLLGKIGSDERPDDVLHPSEICKDGWCHRANYYVLAGHKRTKAPSGPSWRMEMIYEEGHEIHKKWQGRFWDLGRLEGMFFCLHCQYAWWDVSPLKCEKCGLPRQFLVYHEVPLHHDLLRIGGHADGLDSEGPLIEIKSIGVNTLRFENLNLLLSHTYKFRVNGREREFVDLAALWDAIRVPFPSHIRQGTIYAYCLDDITEIIFIYESKWNQGTKEFVIKYNQDRIQTILDRCAEIRKALLEHIPPPCAFGGCGECESYENGDGVAPEANHRGFQEAVRGANRTRTIRRISR